MQANGAEGRKNDRLRKEEKGRNLTNCNKGNPSVGNSAWLNAMQQNKGVTGDDLDG